MVKSRSSRSSMRASPLARRGVCDAIHLTSVRGLLLRALLRLPSRGPLLRFPLAGKSVKPGSDFLQKTTLLRHEDGHIDGVPLDAAKLRGRCGVACGKRPLRPAEYLQELSIVFPLLAHAIV